MRERRPKLKLAEQPALSDVYAADALDVVPSPTGASWPPRVPAKPSKRRKRKPPPPEQPVEVRQLPRVIVRVHGATCARCRQALDYGSKAVVAERLLVHATCSTKTSRLTRRSA